MPKSPEQIAVEKVRTAREASPKLKAELVAAWLEVCDVLDGQDLSTWPPLRCNEIHRRTNRARAAFILEFAASTNTNAAKAAARAASIAWLTQGQCLGREH